MHRVRLPHESEYGHSQLGLPEAGVTNKPGTFPCSIWSGEVMAPRLISSALIAVTEPVRSFFLTLPYPMTTTSSSITLSSFRVMVFREDNCPAFIFK